MGDDLEIYVFSRSAQRTSFEPGGHVHVKWGNNVVLDNINNLLRSTELTSPRGPTTRKRITAVSENFITPQQGNLRAEKIRKLLCLAQHSRHRQLHPSISLGCCKTTFALLEPKIQPLTKVHGASPILANRTIAVVETPSLG